MLVYLGIPRGRKTCYTLIPVTLESRVILDTRIFLREIKRWPYVGTFPVKTSTCFCLFSSHVESEAQELPCYVTSEKKIGIIPRETLGR